MDHVTDIDALKGYDDYVISLGDMLRGERATMNMTLDDVSDQLRIRPELLLAIENSDPSGFVSPGYIAGNVRAYATFLGLDPDEAFRRFCDESGFKGVNNLTLRDQSNAPEKSKKITHKKASQTILSPFGKAENTHWPIFNGVSVGGIASIAAVFAICLTVGLLGFRFLQELQRVELAPLNTAPIVGTSAPNLNATAAQTQTNKNALPTLSPVDEFRRPTELALPKLTPREGPIATLDIATIGVYAPPPPQPVAQITAPPAPKVIEPEIANIDIFAADPAWIRVYQPDGDVLFERILDAGQRYRVPHNVLDGVLKAGNAKSVYLLVGDQVFGPLSTSESVARKVDLQEESIRTTYALAPMQELDLTPPVNAGDITFAQAQ